MVFTYSTHMAPPCGSLLFFEATFSIPPRYPLPVRNIILLYKLITRRACQKTVVLSPFLRKVSTFFPWVTHLRQVML